MDRDHSIEARGEGGGAMEGLEKQHQGSKAGLAGFWSLSLLSNTVRAPDPLKVKFSRPELSQKEIFLHWIPGSS